jgi:hypothetical protein
LRWTSKSGAKLAEALREMGHQVVDRTVLRLLKAEGYSLQANKAIPYGIYDVGRDEGWVSVGISADTAQFAVAAIGSWWQHLGRKRYPTAQTLTIAADRPDRPADPGHALPARHEQTTPSPHQ